MQAEALEAQREISLDKTRHFVFGFAFIGEEEFLQLEI